MFNESWKTQENKTSEWELYEEDSLLTKLIIKLLQASGILIIGGIAWLLIIIFLSFG